MPIGEDEPSQNTGMSDEQHPSSSQADDLSVERPNAVQNAFDRMRPRRTPAEVATITIGGKTVTSMVGSGVPQKRTADSFVPASTFMDRKKRIHTPSRPNIFSQHMKAFTAPGSQATDGSGDGDEEEEEEAEDGVSEDEGTQDDQSQDETQPPLDDQSGYAPDYIEEREEEDSPEHPGGVEVDMQDIQEPVAPDDNKDMTEEEKKAHEEAEVQRLIREAEEKAALPEENTTNRANKMNKGAAHRDSTVQLVGSVDGSLSKIQSQMETLRESLRSQTKDISKTIDADDPGISQETAEDRLSLTVTKDDFAKMRIIGQFNLGFILATRSSEDDLDDTGAGPTSSSSKDELFIIDQHASDEKINFERLQAETVVQNQRLVQPKTLDLTAVEEEIVLGNQATLEKNGFIVDIDDSGNEPIGRRCRLVSLPLSREVVFGIRDLEELIVLLSEMPATGTKYVPRPSKVRKMFAMRACRSSIMIGKNLTQRQMEKVVRNMGTIDKPWNCPHGRPTMRHLMSLGQWDEWDETGDEASSSELGGNKLDLWRNYFQEMGDGSEEGDEEEQEEEEEEA